jgi:hypothetical protein
MLSPVLSSLPVSLPARPRPSPRYFSPHPAWRVGALEALSRHYESGLCNPPYGRHARNAVQLAAVYGTVNAALEPTVERERHSICKGQDLGHEDGGYARQRASFAHRQSLDRAK